ncbi:hypothetical protein [Bacteriophage Eos]|nr:hypothetical protein [Bacteriophage Eos]
MKILVPENNNRPYEEGEKLKRGQVWQAGNVFVIPLDDETGIILNTVTGESRAYFYLLEGLEDFEITTDHLTLTGLTPELTLK